MAPPNYNLTATESARTTILSQMQEGYPHYTPEYTFASLLGALLTASVAPNIPILQRSLTQGFPQGPHPQGLS